MVVSQEVRVGVRVCVRQTQESTVVQGEMCAAAVEGPMLSHLERL